MSLFTSVELLIMGSVLGGLLLIIFILVISELISRRKNNVLEFEKEIEEDIVELEEVKEEKKVFVSENVDHVVEETILPCNNLEIENKNEEVKLIETSSEEIEVIDVIEPVINVIKIESEFDSLLDAREKAQIELLKVEEELEHVPSLEDTITNLEAIEEENAIISYQELLSNTSELNVVSCDDGDEPITISEVFKMFNEDSSKESLNDSLNLPLEEAYNGNFLETPYLSPVNGIECENLAEIQLENTANLEKLEKEIRKTNEFLNILNELKKNLE